MEWEGVEIEDTFAEAFPIKVARVLITAVNEKWAMETAKEATGFGTSVIGCPAEAGIDRVLTGDETPDGRPGVAIMICHFKKDGIKEQLLGRLGQCVFTAPTTAMFNGLDAEEKLPIKLHFFGDGYEYEKEVGGRKVWGIPMMEGDFICEEEYGVQAGVAGGNFFILAKDQMSALIAAENSVAAIRQVEGTITPFTGGVVASGSKIGSKYKFMHASTNEKFCPTLRDKVEGSQIPAGVNGVYEIVINGVSEKAVKEAMRIGIKAAVKVPDVVKISAGNFEGKLGKYQFQLRDVLGL
ncbi:MAG TPA: formylmethanofuran--tetrahydromethanopterin N-formyltransferase [Methanomicrobia archaeon]|nr:formylmethanofuran--tetrahydromethanopterin N-formyltransferase [Methanomicrobia archaeon]